MRCTKCQSDKTDSEFYKTNKYRCKDCIKTASNSWKENNKNQKKITDAKYYKNNTAMFESNNIKFWSLNPNYIKNRRNENREEYNKQQREYQKSTKYKESAYYSKTVLIKTGRMATPETIEVKRELMKINRLIKQMT